MKPLHLIDIITHKHDTKNYHDEYMPTQSTSENEVDGSGAVAENNYSVDKQK